MTNITYDDWKRVDLRVAKIITAEKVPDRDRLYKLKVDIGQEQPIQILSAIVPYYTVEELTGKLIVIVLNLEPRTIAGEVSQGMLLATSVDETHISLLTPDKDVKPGSMIK